MSLLETGMPGERLSMSGPVRQEPYPRSSMSVRLNGAPISSLQTGGPGDRVSWQRPHSRSSISVQVNGAPREVHGPGDMMELLMRNMAGSQLPGNRLREIMEQLHDDEHDGGDRLREIMERSMQDQPVGRPAAERTIAALPTHTVTAEDIAATPEEHKSCCVCMEDFKEGDEQRTLPCFHRFHKACVDQWLHQSGACPICKHPVYAGRR